MNKKGHWVLGILFVLAVILILGFFNLNILTLNFYSLTVILGLTLFYSLLPDIDHKAGTLTWTFLTIGIIGLILGVIQLVFSFGNFLTTFIFSSLFLVVILISANYFKHRGIIHTIQAGLLFVIPVWFLFHSFVFCLFAYTAWYSHLVGDGYLFKVR